VNVTFPTKPAAACFALACFAVALMAGLAADREASSILGTALIALLLGQIVGTIAASAIAWAMRESVERYVAARPVPDSFASLRDQGAGMHGGMQGVGASGGASGGGNASTGASKT
jgi:hypothetical protein